MTSTNISTDTLNVIENDRILEDQTIFVIITLRFLLNSLKEQEKNNPNCERITLSFLRHYAEYSAFQVQQNSVRPSTIFARLCTM